jgi:hypothetical protein
MPELTPKTPLNSTLNEPETILEHDQMIISPDYPVASQAQILSLASNDNQNKLVKVPFLVRIIPLLLVAAVVAWDLYTITQSQDPWLPLNIGALIAFRLPFFILSFVFLIKPLTKKNLRRIIIALVITALLSTPGGLASIFTSVKYLAKLNQISDDKSRARSLGYDIYLPTEGIVKEIWSPYPVYPRIYDNYDVGTIVSYYGITEGNYSRSKNKFGDCPPPEMLREKGTPICKFFAKTPSGIDLYIAEDDGGDHNILPYIIMHRDNTQILFMTNIFDKFLAKDNYDDILKYADGFKKTDIKDITFEVKGEPTKL